MTTHQLAPALDTAAAAALRATLLGHVERGEPMILDASGVERVGLACLQVLASARATAAAANLHFEVQNPSAPFVAMTGLSRADILLDPVN